MTEEPPKPKTWAAVAAGQKPTSSAGIGMPQHAAPKAMDKPQGQRAPRQHRERQNRENARSNGGENTGSGAQSENHRGGRMGGQGQQGAAGGKYSDAHQLFVGNLPHNIEEPELKEFFEKGTFVTFQFNLTLPFFHLCFILIYVYICFADYGKVIEVRINRKNPPRDVPVSYPILVAASSIRIFTKSLLSMVPSIFVHYADYAIVYSFLSFRILGLLYLPSLKQSRVFWRKR